MVSSSAVYLLAVEMSVLLMFTARSQAPNWVFLKCISGNQIEVGICAFKCPNKSNCTN